jgi:hypothetical protein
VNFTDKGDTFPLNTLVWCVPKLFDEKPKITQILQRDGGERIITNSDLASDYLFGDEIPEPQTVVRPKPTCQVKIVWGKS